MVKKVKISLTDEDAQLLRHGVKCGGYATPSEIIQEAMEDWQTKRIIGQLWDEGVNSGRADED